MRNAYYTHYRGKPATITVLLIGRDAMIAHATGDYEKSSVLALAALRYTSAMVDYEGCTRATAERFWRVLLPLVHD